MQPKFVACLILLPLLSAPAMAQSFSSAPAASHPAALELTCMGGGEANKVKSSTGFAFSGGTSAWGGGTYQTESGFQDQVDIKLFGGSDVIRLPRHMLPPIHGGENGWFPLTDVVSTDRDINASAGINFASHPKVHIDRVTGSISIEGRAGNFVGQCRKFDPDADKPKF